jgi:L-asparagine oxygenase
MRAANIGAVVLELELERDARELLGEALVAMPDPQQSPDDALLTLYPLFAQLPKTLMRGLLDFAHKPTSPGALIVRGLPTDPDLPPTQSDGEVNRLKRTFVSENSVLGISQVLGEPVAYQSAKQGRLVHDIVPVPGRETTLSNQGSLQRLDFHNDISYDPGGIYHRTNPDFLILLGLRVDPDRSGYTFLAEACVLTARLSQADVALLRQPLFRMNAPERHCLETARGAAVLSDVVPVFSGPHDTPEISIASNGVHALTSSARAALERLRAACSRRDVGTGVLLEPGDALLINNRKTVHARAAFRARYDGTDRWLQRTQIRRSLWDSRQLAVDGCRVFP